VFGIFWIEYEIFFGMTDLHCFLCRIGNVMLLTLFLFVISVTATVV